MHKLMGLFAVLLLAVTAPLGQASIVLTYTIDGVNGSVSPCGPAATPGGVDCGPGNLGNANVTISGLSAFSNSPGGASALETGSNTAIVNTDTASHHIVINIVANGYTSPVGLNIGFLSHIGGTVAIGSAANTLSFMSCIDTANTLTGCPGTSSVTGAPSITGVGTFNDDKSGTIASLAGTYSLAEKIDIVIGAASAINFSSSTTLTNGVPEPMSITLLGGVILLVSRSIRRKHYQVS